MLKSKKLFAIMFLSAGLFFLLTGTQKAQAQTSGLFLSTLSKIPNYKIVKDFGFIYINNNHRSYIVLNFIGHLPTARTLFSINSTGVPGVASIMKDINRIKPSGANGCINLKFGHGDDNNDIVFSCEYAKLVPRKK